MTLYAAAVVPPLEVGHDGRYTRVSRGMLTMVARVCALLMCTTIAVSERAPVLWPPPSFWFALPLRESEPSTRMFIAPVATGARDEEEGEDEDEAEAVGPVVG